jgi:hypothetical protein
VPDIFGILHKYGASQQILIQAPPPQYQIWRKAVQWEWRWYIQTDGKTDAGHDGDSRHFSPKKWDGAKRMKGEICLWTKICGPQGLHCMWLCLALRIISHPQTGGNMALLVSLRRRLRIRSNPHYVKRKAWTPEEKTNLVSLRERITCQQSSCWRYQ